MPPPRIMLLTQPKAGTYLLSELIRRLGFHQTFYHLRLDSLDAYDRHRLDAGRRQPHSCRVEIPIEQSARLIRCAEFGAGHLACCARALAALEGFRLIFAQREQRASLVSCMRFRTQTGRPWHGAGGARAPESDPRAATVEFLKRSGPVLLEQARAALGWRDHPEALALRFEDVRADPAEAARRIAAHLGVRAAPETTSALEAADTLTRSSEATAIEPFWSDEAETVFGALGGHQVNAGAGCDAPAPLPHACRQAETIAR